MISKNAKRPLRSGFTIIEMLVVVVLLTIVIGATTSVLTATVNTASKTDSSNTIKQNGSEALEAMERMVRGAIRIKTASGGILEVENADNTVTRFQRSASATCADSASPCTRNQELQQIDNYTAAGPNVSKALTDGSADGVHVISFAVNKDFTDRSIDITLVLRPSLSLPDNVMFRVDADNQVTFKTTVTTRNE